MQVFGFMATIVFAFDFYIIFNDLADFLKQGGQPSEETPRRTGDTRALRHQRWEVLTFLAAFFLLFAYSTKFNERFTGYHWPLMDFLRCASASIIFFVISIISVSKYSDGASKAAGVFGFMATI
ncbi:hypothetical protein CRUP_001180, partial [Coryphaenoides rupestris]